MSFENWMRTGNLVDEQFCFHDIPERLDPCDYEAFDRGHTRFYVACSNVETGKQVSGVKICSEMSNISVRRHPFRMCPIWSDRWNEAFARTAAARTAFRCVTFAKMGYKKCVVVLTRPAGYRKKPTILAADLILISGVREGASIATLFL